MNILLSRPRRPRWQYTLLDRLDRPLGALDGVQGGRFADEYQALLGAQLDLAIDEIGQPIDWLSSRVRVDYDPGIPGAQPWPHGIFLFDSPQDAYASGGRVTHDVSLLSKLAVLDRSRILTRYTLEEGSPVVPAVVALIQAAGETRISAVESAAVLTELRTFEVGTKRIDIINDLLQSIAYEPLRCDMTGQFRISPLRKNEAPVYEFLPGPWAVHMPDFTEKRDLGSVRNIWITMGQGTEDDPPMLGTAYNRDPASPFAIQYIGESVGITDGVEADEQATYDALARQSLLESMAVASTFSMTHAIVPISVGDFARFQPMGGSAPVLVQVRSLSCDLTMDAHYSAEMSEVVKVELGTS